MRESVADFAWKKMPTCSILKKLRFFAAFKLAIDPQPHMHDIL